MGRNSSAAAGGEGQVGELLGRAQGSHCTVPSSRQRLLHQEQQWLLAQGCPRSQDQDEGRAGLGKALAEEALVNQIFWLLSGAWGSGRAGGPQGSRARGPVAPGSLVGFGRQHRQLGSTGCLKAPRQQQEAARLPAKAGDSRLLALTGEQSLAGTDTQKTTTTLLGRAGL